MDAKEFVTLTLLVTGGEIRGNTKLQKTVYFFGLMTGKLEELGYRDHFYGPYSDEVANAVTQLKTIGAVDQNVSDWGYDRSGFEVKRYDYRLNAPGTHYAQTVAGRNPDLWRKLQAANEVYQRAGDKDYMTLSVAAKTYFLLGQKKAPATEAELAKLAEQFGWTVATNQVGEAIDYLVTLGLVVRPSESTDSIPTVGKQMNDAASVPQEWSREVADSFPAPQRRIAELKAEVERLRKAIAGNLGGNDLCFDDPIEQLEKACVDAGQMAWNLGIRVIESDKLHEAEVERLTQERDVVRREIETIREACGWEQSGELTSVLVERMHADLKDLRQDLEEVNEFARSLGHGQGAIDNGLVDCLKESFAKYEQLRGLVREFQVARAKRVKPGDPNPEDAAMIVEMFCVGDNMLRYDDAVKALDAVTL